MAKRHKKLVKAAGGKRAQAQAAPSVIPPISSPGSSPGSTLAVIDPLYPAPLRAEAALQERQRKQQWTNLPKKSRIRSVISKATALQIDGKTTEEIAEILGVRPATIRQYRWIAGKNGWLTTNDPHEQAEYELTHRAVSNLQEWLHARNKETGLPDKEMTLETLKGMGVFKDHSKGDGTAAPMTNVLSINITMPTTANGAPLPTIREGNVSGTPAYIEGEIDASKSG